MAAEIDLTSLLLLLVVREVLYLSLLAVSEASNLTMVTKRNLKILSANVRGFQTNIGDLTHSFINREKPDVVVTVETFLNETHPPNFGQLSGYTSWIRKDREGRRGGGIAVCFKKNLHLQPLEISVPDFMEMMFFRVCVDANNAILLCACYRPWWQRTAPIDLLAEHLDDLLLQNNCKNFILVGDLNQHEVQSSFDSFLDVHGLRNYVNFPTHSSGSSLDPVVTDLDETIVECKPLGFVGSSDHQAVLAQMKIALECSDEAERTIWLWDKGNWQSMCSDMASTAWDTMLSGEVSQIAESLTKHILTLRDQHIPSKKYVLRDSNQPWFGYQCQVASDAKYKAWCHYKKYPTRNKKLHRAACRKMVQVQKWAKIQWTNDMQQKLRGGNIGTKQWWSLIKEQQGFSRDETIPPLQRPDGSVATTTKDKVNLLAEQFATKMQVPEPERLPPSLRTKTAKRLQQLDIDQDTVRKLLQDIDTNKATGPDDVSPHILKRCARELSLPLTILFQKCITQGRWPPIWKRARVVPVHKKKSRSVVSNYRPVSLLSIVGKTFEKIITDQITAFLQENRLLNERQFGFRKGRSAADLLLLLSNSWHDSLDKGSATCVIALDIAGAFDRVWHDGLMEKLRAVGIDGILLCMLSDYLKERKLHVVLNGITSEEYAIGASVPQGSVLGPLLWNIYFNDLLDLIPEAHAYADDCTMSFQLNRGETKEKESIIRDRLKLIEAWGNLWQVTFAPEMSQMMIVTRTQNPQPQLKLSLGSTELVAATAIEILGVKFDKEMTLKDHVKALARKSAAKLTALRRISSLLDKKGCKTLYEAQVRPLMEYAPLSWMACPPSYLTLLDRVDHRARRLISSCSGELQDTRVQCLHSRRLVAGLTVLYKASFENNYFLAPLRLQPRQRTSHNTRSSAESDYAVSVPSSRTALHQRTFLPVMARFWNKFIKSAFFPGLIGTQSIKCSVNRWLISNHSILSYLGSV